MGELLEFNRPTEEAVRETRIQNRFKEVGYTARQFMSDLLYCDLVKLNLTYAPLIDILEEFECFKEQYDV